MNASRRSFLRRSLKASMALGLGAGVRTHAADTVSERRNLLLIMTDQQFADTISGLNRIVDPLGFHTPNMDRLLASGASFQQAYVAHPLCVPARNSLFTGRFPHETGIMYNRSYNASRADSRIPLGMPMMGSFLRNAGYDCGYVGKWHLLAPNKGDPTGSTHGFPFVRHAVANGIDNKVAGACREFFDQWTGENPFCLVASWVNPHDICEFARNESGNYNDSLPNGSIGSPPPDLAQLPPLRPNHDLAPDEPGALRRLRENPANLTWLDRLYPTNNYTETNWRRYLWAYHRMVEKVDAQIGELLDDLDARGLTDSTTILFTSDHGEGYGSHLWNQKQCFYEEVSRVPMIISGAGVTKKGVRDSDHITSVCLDIIPTMLDFAGASVPSNLPGRSLKPLVQEGPAVAWRDHCVLQTEFGGWGSGQQSGITGRCVCSNQFKYILYHDVLHPTEVTNEQLFHLPSDPGETNNLTLKEAFRIELHRHRRWLLDHLVETGDVFPAKPSAWVNPEGSGDRGFLRLETP